MSRWRLVEVVSGGRYVVLLLGVRMVVLQWIFGVRRAGPVERGTVGPHVMKRGLGVRGPQQGARRAPGPTKKNNVS